MPSCQECQKICEENLGRHVIMGQDDEGFEWVFLCLDCIRSWRARGLEREGYTPKKIKNILNKEYPIR